MNQSNRLSHINNMGIEQIDKLDKIVIDKMRSQVMYKEEVMSDRMFLNIYENTTTFAMIRFNESISMASMAIRNAISIFRTNQCKKKVKDSLVFNDVFIEKIKSGQKTYTIRNSPVSFGTKKIRDCLSVYVYEVKRVVAEDSIFNDEPAYKFYNEVDKHKEWIKSNWCTGHRQLGFDSRKDMYKFYKQYLKRGYAYEIYFRVIQQ